MELRTTGSQVHRPHIAFSFLLTQICRNCRLPVTCGPVHVINDLSILCGRCRMFAKEHYRNYSYEALASLFLYPCVNWQKHCPAGLQWNESLEHEKRCGYTGCCSMFCSHPGAFFKGNRSIPKDEVRPVSIPEHLLEYIKCVECEGYLNCEPVFIQTNGKNVCHRCINANGNPPNSRRNHAYESFSRICIFPCIYRNRGCTERMFFGKQLWQHESECPYGQTYKKKPKQNQKQTSTNQKERGVIKTHSGHIWATLTPNTPLFAPPDDLDDNSNKELMKSLAKKQGRHFPRADDLDFNSGRSFDNDSLSTNNSVGRQSPGVWSGNSTPVLLESPSRNSVRAGSGESGFHELHHHPSGTQYINTSRPLSRESGNHPQPHDDRYFPVLLPRQLDEGFGSISQRLSQRDSFQKEPLGYKESFSGNRLLISELKLKQDEIKRTHSIKGERDRVHK